jgi:hypothetical protein
MQVFRCHKQVHNQSTGGAEPALALKSSDWLPSTRLSGPFHRQFHHLSLQIKSLTHPFIVFL